MSAEFFNGILHAHAGAASFALGDLHPNSPSFRPCPDERSDMEKAMLNNAYDVTDASRLACQIVLSEQLDGLSVQVVDS